LEPLDFVLAMWEGGAAAFDLFQILTLKELNRDNDIEVLTSPK
jgi:hypothetical protein